MAFQFLAKLLRCVRGSSSTRSLTPPALSAGFHVDLHQPDPDDAPNVAVGAAERKQAIALEALKYPLPELANISSRDLHDGSVTLTVPQGLDFDSLTWKLGHSPSFKWEQQGEVVVRDEFNAHSIRYKRTLSNVWHTKSEAIRKRATCGRDEIVQRAAQWMESFVSGADPGVFSRIRSSVDMSTIWDHLACCIDAALDGRSLDEPPSPGKEIPAPAHTAFFTLGVFDLPDRGELKMKIYSVRLTGWADFSAEDGYLRSGIRGELKYADYRVTAPPK